jgi:hypothetical protein
MLILLLTIHNSTCKTIFKNLKMLHSIEKRKKNESNEKKIFLCKGVIFPNFSNKDFKVKVDVPKDRQKNGKKLHQNQK